MVKRLSDKIACYMSCQLKYDKEKEEVLSYGLEIALGGLFKILTLVTVSLILGTFYYTMMGMISFSAFRAIIGGAHQDTYEKCFAISIALLLIIGCLGKNINFFIDKNMWVLYLVLGQALLSTLVWVPAGTEKKEIKNKNLRLKMKVAAIILLIIWFMLIIYSSKYNYHQYALSSILGVFSAFFFVTPPAYKLMEMKLKFEKGVI